MRACPGCADWIPDAARFCPSCGKEQGAAAAGTGGPPAGEPAPATEGHERGRAESRIRTLGTLSIAVGVWVLLAQAFSIVMAVTGMTAEIVAGMNTQGNPRVQELLDRYMEILESPIAAALPGVLGLGIGAFYCWSGSRLRALRDPGAAQAAAIAMIFLSCCHSDCCACCFTIPLGVYALFVLNAEASRAVFRE